MAEAIMAQNPGMTQGEANAAVKRFMAEVAKTPKEFMDYINDILYPDASDTTVLLNEKIPLGLAGLDDYDYAEYLSLVMWFLITPKSPSEDLLNFIKDYEEFRKIPYIGQDTRNYTMGYGHKFPRTDSAEYEKYKDGISREDANILLMKDLREKALQYLNPYLYRNNIRLSQQQYDALVSFTFNVGSGWITNPNVTDLRTILESGDITDAAIHDEFMTWIKTTTDGIKVVSEGLYRRRIDEYEIFSIGDYTRGYPTIPAYL